MPGEKRKRCSYDARFKLEVVQFALESNNNSKTAREFGVSEKQVREWRKCGEELAAMPKTKKACRRGVTPYAKEEAALND